MHEIAAAGAEMPQMGWIETTQETTDYTIIVIETEVIH